MSAWVSSTILRWVAFSSSSSNWSLFSTELGLTMEVQAGGLPLWGLAILKQKNLKLKNN